MLPTRKGQTVYCPLFKNFYKVTSIRTKRISGGLGWSLKFLYGSSPGCVTMTICSSEFERQGMTVIDKDMAAILHENRQEGLENGL